MTWVKLEHGTPTNRKVAPLSDRAFRAWVHMICWSVGSGTDGFISDLIPRRFFADSKHAKKIIQELWEAGLLDRIDDGFAIHDFADYQLSAAEHKAARDAATKRQRAARERRRNGSTPTPIDDDQPF